MKIAASASEILQEKVAEAGFYLDLDEVNVIVAAMEEYAKQIQNNREIAIGRCECEVCDPTEIKVCTNCNGYVE